MKQLHLLRIFWASLALTACTVLCRPPLSPREQPLLTYPARKARPAIPLAHPRLVISAGTGYFTVTPPTVPWLLVTPMAGTADTTASDNVLTFSVSPGWTTLGAGLSTTTVNLVSTGNTGTSITVTLEVQSATPTLVVKGGVNTLNPVALSRRSGGAHSLTSRVIELGIAAPLHRHRRQRHHARGRQ